MAPTKPDVSDDEFEASHEALLDAVSKHFVDTNGVTRGVTLSSRENKEDAVMMFALSVPLEDADEMFEVLKHMAEIVDEHMNKVFELEED